MRKIQLLFAVMLMSILSIGQVCAETYLLGWGSATGDPGTYTNFSATSGSVTGIVSFTSAQNSSGTAPAYNANNSELRLYYAGTGDGGSVTLTPADGVTITGFAMTTSTTPAVNYSVDGGSATSVSVGAGSVYSVTGISATSSLKIQNVNTSNVKLFIKTIEITYTAAAASKCATPTFSVESQTFYSELSVEMACTTTGATIHYTTNGDIPTSSSPTYSAPLSITSTTTVKAIAVLDGMDDSDVATATYTKGASVASYDIDFEEGNVSAYSSWNFVNITCVESGSINAHAGDYYGNTGGSFTASITTKDKILLPGTLTFYTSKESKNTTTSAWTVEVSEDGENWTIEESFDATVGSKGEWTARSCDLSDYSNVYVRIAYGSNNAIRAIDDISLEMRTPAAIEAPSILGTILFLNSTTVTLSCITEGASIYYTLDGSEPDPDGIDHNLYTEPIVITSTTTVKALSVKGDDRSEVVSKTFTKATVLSVAEALAVIDGLNNGATSSEFYYVGGFVTNIIEMSISEYHNATYVLRTTPDATDSLLIYRGKNLEDAGFTSEDQLGVGDSVIVYGRLQKYQDKELNVQPEMAQGNYLAQRTAKGHVVSVVVTGGVIKTEYEFGESLDPTGFTVIGTFVSGYTADVTDLLEFDPVIIDGDGARPVVGRINGTTWVDTEVYVTVKRHHVYFGSDGVGSGTVVVKAINEYQEEETISNGQEFPKETVLTITITPNSDSKLSNVSCTGATIENGQFTIGTEDVNIVVTFAEKPFASLAWNDDGETNVTVGDPFTQKTLDNPDNLPVKYSSSDPSVATIDENTGVITLVAAGATEIWANFDGNEDFRPAGAKYTLNVTEPVVYTLTLHIATIPDEGISEADLFAAISFGTFDNDETEGHEFVQYESGTLVMAGTFNEGTVLNFENFSSKSYEFVKWSDDESTTFYHGVDIFQDTVITMYIAPFILQPLIVSQDEEKGTVTLVNAQPLYIRELFNPASTWTLEIKAEPKEGYKFLGWGPYELEKAVGEDPEYDWFSGAYKSVEEFFADERAVYDDYVAAGDALNDAQKDLRDYYQQIFSAEAVFTVQQMYIYENAFALDSEEGIYSVEAFFTEDEDTPTDIVSPSLQGRSGEASKSLIDGQLIIIKNGVKYNAQGAILK